MQSMFAPSIPGPSFGFDIFLQTVEKRAMQQQQAVLAVPGNAVPPFIYFQF